MGKVIAVTNQKGGVGKTTTTVNLAAALAAQHYHVLLIDLDPQGNATMGCGIDKNHVEHSINDVLLERIELTLVLVSSSWGFEIAPGNADLTEAEVGLLQLPMREHRLLKAISKIRGRYDYILIDCPPSLNMLTVNALVAADSVLIPMQCEYYALEGLTSLLSTIEKITQTVNKKLHIEGLLRTMFDTRNSLTEQVSAQLTEHFGDQVYQTTIPRNVRLAEAPSHGMPGILYDKQSSGAEAYRALAREISSTREQTFQTQPTTEETV